MAERSYPFDAGPGATINEDQWSYLAGVWQDDGVQALGPWDTSLKLTSANEALLLHIAAGHANISGIHYHLDAERTIAFASNAAGNPRIDRIVLKLDRVTNTVSFLYKQGTAAASPIAPTVDRAWDSPEINIATFTVRANSSNVLPAEVFDERDFVGRYVKVTEDVAGQQQGTIAYQPSVGKFFAKGASTIEIGEQPDLTPYLTKASASSTYSPIHSHPYSSNTHKHYPGDYSNNQFSISAASGWVVESSSWGACASETVSFRVNLRRTNSSSASSSELIATYPTAYEPAYYASFVVYVYSANLSSVTKAGFVEASSGNIRTRDTFVGYDERIWLGGSWLLSTGRQSAGPS